MEGSRDLLLDIHEEFLQIRLGSDTKHRSKHWSEGVVWMAIQDVYFIVVSNETNGHSICDDKCRQIWFSVLPLLIKSQRTLGDLGVCCCD